MLRCVFFRGPSGCGERDGQEEAGLGEAGRAEKRPWKEVWRNGKKRGERWCDPSGAVSRGRAGTSAQLPLHVVTIKCGGDGDKGAGPRNREEENDVSTEGHTSPGPAAPGRVSSLGAEKGHHIFLFQWRYNPHIIIFTPLTCTVH